MSETGSTVDLEETLRAFAPEATLVRAWELLGGISATMTAFEIRHPDGSLETLILRQIGAYALQQAPLAARLEHDRLAYLRANGLAVSAPRYLDPLGAFYVLGFLPGKPDLQPADRSDYLRRYADQLAAIHSVPLADASQGLFSTSKSRFDPSSLELPSGFQDPRIGEYLKSYPPLSPNESTLLHGDYWPGNVIWEDGRISGVIDWENARVGEPLLELGIARLDLLWIFGSDAMEEFTDLYLARRPLDLTDLPTWDLRASLRLMPYLEKCAVAYPPLGRPDVNEESMTDDLRWFIDHALTSSGKRPSF